MIEKSIWYRVFWIIADIDTADGQGPSDFLDSRLLSSILQILFQAKTMRKSCDVLMQAYQKGAT